MPKIVSPTYKRLREKRIELGVSQQQLADLLNIERKTYGYKELGYSDFTIREAKLLADVFKTDLNSLFN